MPEKRRLRSSSGRSLRSALQRASGFIEHPEFEWPKRYRGGVERMRKGLASIQEEIEALIGELVSDLE